MEDGGLGIYNAGGISSHDEPTHVQNVTPSVHECTWMVQTYEVVQPTSGQLVIETNVVSLEEVWKGHVHFH